MITPHDVAERGYARHQCFDHRGTGDSIGTFRRTEFGRAGARIGSDLGFVGVSGFLVSTLNVGGATSSGR